MLHSEFQNQKEINAALKSVKETYRRLYNIEYLKDIKDMIEDLSAGDISIPIQAISYTASLDEVAIIVANDLVAEEIIDLLKNEFEDISYEEVYYITDTYIVRIGDAIDTLTK